MFTFFVFSTGWNIAKAKILQGANLGCPLVECLPGDGAHWHQKDAKVSEGGEGVVLHGRARERRSHEAETRATGSRTVQHSNNIISHLFYLRATTTAVSDKARLLFNTDYPKRALHISIQASTDNCKVWTISNTLCHSLTTTSIAPHPLI